MENEVIRTSAIRLCSALALALTFQPAFAGGDAPMQKSADNMADTIRGDVVAARVGWELISQGALLIDVRSSGEYESGHIEGSLNIPHSEIAALAEAIGPEMDRSVVFYCRSGGRAGRAHKALEDLGYTGIFNASGYDALTVTSRWIS